MGNQQSTRRNDKGELVAFGKSLKPTLGTYFENVRLEFCYQYRCGWDTGVSFMHCIRTRLQTTYFCINYPACAIDRLKTAIKKQPDIVYRDFFLDALVADDSMKQWQFEIGHRRNALHTYVRIRSDASANLPLICRHRRSNMKTSTSTSTPQLSSCIDFPGTG
jgi:hypothetical protein